MSEITHENAIRTPNASTTCEFPPVTSACAQRGNAGRTRSGRRARRGRRALIAAAALSLGLLGGSLALATPAQAEIVGGVGVPELAVMSATGLIASPTISVTGVGSVSVEPDVAKLSFAVEVDAESATAAAEGANELADAVNAALEGVGVEAADIQTGGVSVSSRYTYDDAGNATVSGYHASVQYDVSGVAVADVADVLGAAMGAGVTQVYTIAYYSSTYDEHYQQALAQAVEQAKAKAQALLPALATSDGAKLSLESVAESPSSMQYRYADAGAFQTMESAADMAASGGAKVSSTVVPGTIEIEANVTVTYGLIDPGAYTDLLNGFAAGTDVTTGAEAVKVFDSSAADAR